MNQPQPSAPAPAPSGVEGPQGGSSTMKWLLIILVIIIVLGGGYLLYSKYGKGTSSTTASPSPTVTAKTSPSTSAAVSPTASSSVPADWKTYTSSLGYIISYPANWILGSNDPKRITLDSPENRKNKGIEGYTEDVVISYYDKVSDFSESKNVTSLQDLFKNDATIINPKEITFAAQKAYEAIIGGMTANYAIMAEKNGHLYVIFNNQEIPFSGTAKQIVDTFQSTQ